MLSFDKDTLHHAYGIALDVPDSIDIIETALKATLQIDFTGNPDVVKLNFETLGVNESRVIGELALTLPIGPRKIVMIRADVLTAEAQNALLKLFEEPKVGTHFFVIVRTFSGLLPTLRSRLYQIDLTESGRDVTEAKKFMTATPKDKLTLLKKIIDEKDRKEALHFLDGLETYLINTSVKKNASLLREILMTKKYLSAKGSSIKMLLEHLSLIANL